MKRLGHAVIVIIGVTIAVFLITRMTGDPVRLMAPLDASAKDIELLRTQLGFNRPLPVQFLEYLKGVAVLDFGDSLRHRQPAMIMVFERMPATIQLTLVAIVMAILVAVPAGVIGATRKGSIADAVGTLLALLGQSMPVYWLGILLIIVFGVQLKWLPAGGKSDWTSFILPAATLAAFTAASIMRMLRSGMLEVMTQDFIRTARAKGIAERYVLYKHALRNALIPVVTVIGLQMGALLSGSVITETIYAWPGVGRFVVQAINNRDFFVVQAAVFLFALIIVVINLATDVLYSLLDPRIRYS
jgi:peptide/nickel transport system permease protein